ncbi:dephospho-CoA kinase [Aureivirga sp. CE67]|uniref:dephospho-CoA kinase n=1 Tax=Aureivirga sp. CE67 TaxID=1788983 RepID=UPI0018C9633C|nr:dephospho-CoA kinase [Aureivirga sp. CE67]
MKVIGLTGGIGSGKTTVAKLFQELHIPTYIADTEAKEIMNTSEKLKEKIIKNFGENSYKNRKLNREYLANIVFNDKNKLELLNSIVHPEVFKHFEMFKENNRLKDYIIYENAILFENGSDKLCDKIIVVTAPLENRIERVIKRDKSTKEEVLARIDKQLPDEIKIEKADYVIENKTESELKLKVLKIHNELLNN